MQPGKNKRIIYSNVTFSNYISLKNFEIDNSYFFKVLFNVYCVCLSRCNLNKIHYPKYIVLMKKKTEN